MDLAKIEELPKRSLREEAGRAFHLQASLIPPPPYPTPSKPISQPPPPNLQNPEPTRNPIPLSSPLLRRRPWSQNESHHNSQLRHDIGRRGKSNNTFETTSAGVEKIEKFFASRRSSTFASNPSFVVSKFLVFLLCYGRTQLELLVKLKDVIASKRSSWTQLQLGAKFKDVYS
ncbi:unnamed protein product [Prunus armeniaca]